MQAPVQQMLAFALMSTFVVVLVPLVNVLVLTVWYCRFAGVSVTSPAVARVRLAYCALETPSQPGGLPAPGPSRPPSVVLTFQSHTP